MIKAPDDGDPAGSALAGRKEVSRRHGRSLAPLAWVMLLLVVPSLIYVFYVLDQIRALTEGNLRLLGRAATRLEAVLDNAATTVKNRALDLRFACDFVDRQPYLTLVEPGRCETLQRYESAEVEIETRYDAGRGRLLLTAVPQGDAGWEGFSFAVELERILHEVPLADHFDLLLLADRRGDVVVQVAGDGAAGHGLRITRIDKLPMVRGGEEPLAFAAVQRASLERSVELFDRDHRLFCQPLAVRGGAAGAWALCGLVRSGDTFQQALVVSPILTLILILLLIFGLLTWPFIKLFSLDRRERFRFADGFLLLFCTFVLLLLLTLLTSEWDSGKRLHEATETSLEVLAAELEEDLLAELNRLYDQVVAFDRHLCAQRMELDVCGLKEDANLLDPKRPPAAFRLPRPAIEDFSSVFWMRPCDGLQIAKATVRSKNTPAVRLGHREYFRTLAEGRSWRVGSPPDEERRFFVQAFRSVTTGERGAALSIRSCLSDPGGVAELTKGEDCRLPPCRSAGVVVAAISAPLASVDRVLTGPDFGFAIVEPGGGVLFHSDRRRALDENLLLEVDDSKRLNAALSARIPRSLRMRYHGRPHLLHAAPLRDLPWSVVTFVDRELLRTTSIEALALSLVLAAAYLVPLLLGSIAFALIAGREASWLWPDPAKERLYRHLSWIFAQLLLAFTLALYALPAESALLAAFTMPLMAALIAWLRLMAWKLRHRRNATLWRALDLFSVPLLLLLLILGLVALKLANLSLSWRDPWLVGPFVGMLILTALYLLIHGWRDFSRPWRYRVNWLAWHCTAIVLFWLLLAVWPAVGFFKIAFVSQQRVLVKHENLHRAEGVRQLACALEDELRDVAMPDRDASLNRRLAAARHRHRPHMLAALHPGGDPPEVSDVGSWFDRGLRDLLARYQPLYNRTTESQRYLLGTRAADGAWEWRGGLEGGGDGAMRFHARAGPCQRRDLSLVSVLPVPGHRLTWRLAAGGAILILLLAAWVRYSARRLFFAAVEGQVERLGVAQLVRGELPVNTIALLASPRDRQLLVASKNYDVVDLERPVARAQWLGGLDHEDRKPVVCEHFEDGLADAGVRRFKLEVLESLVYAEHRRVLILSTVDPYEALLRFHHGAGPEAAGGAGDDLGDDEAGRWSRLLSHFVLKPVGLDRQSAGAEEGDSHDGETSLSVRVERELGATVHLRRLVQSDLASFDNLSQRELLERIVDAAEGYYWALWNACSEDEKLVLVQLAQETFVNPKQHSTVRRLLQRGLIVRDPVLRLMNDSFTLFVHRIQQPKEVARWERSLRGLGWKQLRLAFIALLAVVALFLFSTQRGLFDATIGYVSALAVGIPGLIQLLRTLYAAGRTGG